jgi:hypothetical protein
VKTTRTLDAVDLSMARAIAYRVAGKHDDDAESAAMDGLLKAAQTWDANRGAWVTYAVRQIRWSVLSQLRKNVPEPIDVTVLPDTTHVVGIITSYEGAALLHDALALLDADCLLDGVDMRRNAHRALVEQLREVLA